MCPDDLGDAPTSYGVLRANWGAFHAQDPLKPLRLGLTVDTEPDGQPSTLAWGDLDPDEDGLMSTAMHQGDANGNMVVRSVGNGLLQAFVDFNQDGAWQITEQIAFNVPLAGGAPQIVPVSVPANAVIGTTYMRLRFSDVPGLFALGGAPNGEVEDHAVRICPPWSETCCRRVVFVADQSNSMNKGAANELAETAVETLLAALPIPPSEAAVVTFRDQVATLRASMQENKANLVTVADATISEGPIGGATHFEPGIVMAQGQLGTELPSCENVMILITDGPSNHMAPDYAAAAVAEGSGTRLFVIGIDVSPLLVQELVTLASPSSYFDMSDGGDLPDVVDAILNELACTAPECPSPGAPAEQLPDLGDAPDSTNHFQHTMTAYSDVTPNISGRFPSVGDIVLTQPFGPSHLLPTSDAYLGTKVTREFDADYAPDDDRIPNLGVITDDADNDGADDGMGFPLAIEPCGSTTFAYTLTVTGGVTPRYVNTWIDYNRDGDWEDTLTCSNPEHGLLQVQEWSVRNHQIAVGPGVHTLVSPSFNSIRSQTAAQSRMWLRLSVSDSTAPFPFDGRGPGGGYQYGETEDYLIQRNGDDAFEPYPEN